MLSRSIVSQDPLSTLTERTLEWGGARGLTSFCVFKPYGSIKGVRGFFAGLGAGLAGVVVLPMAGAVTGVTSLVRQSGKGVYRRGRSGEGV
jgi:hypothetical protein